MTFLIPLIALVSGILLGMHLESPFWGVIPIILGLTYYFYLLKKTSTPITSVRFNQRHYVWIFLLFFGIGIFDMWFHAPKRLTDEELKSFVAAEGEIKGVNTSTTGDVLVVDINRLVDKDGSVSTCRNLRVTVYTDGLTTSYGDIVLFPFRLSEIKDNPNYRPTGYSGRMARKGIIYRCFIKSDEIIVKGFHQSIMAASKRWRDRICIKLENSSLDRECAEFLIAIVLGDKTLLSPEIKESFSNAGIAHVLALSGMHIAIIMGMLVLLLFPLRFIQNNWISSCIAVSLLWGFAFFPG